MLGLTPAGKSLRVPSPSGNIPLVFFFFFFFLFPPPIKGRRLTELMLEYFIDVQDTALLHVAAAIHTGVKSERIFGFAEQVSGHRILAILRKLYPGRTFPAEFQPADDLSNIVGRPRAEELLRDVGQKGWTSLEESIRKNTEDLV